MSYDVPPTVKKARQTKTFYCEVKASDQLPPGWIVHINRRLTCTGNRTYDLYWFSKTGKKLRSHPEIVKFLGHLHDVNGDEDAAWKRFKSGSFPVTTVTLAKREGRGMYLKKDGQDKATCMHDLRVQPRKKQKLVIKGFTSCSSGKEDAIKVNTSNANFTFNERAGGDGDGDGDNDDDNDDDDDGDGDDEVILVTTTKSQEASNNQISRKSNQYPDKLAHLQLMEKNLTRAQNCTKDEKSMEQYLSVAKRYAIKANAMSAYNERASKIRKEKTAEESKAASKPITKPQPITQSEPKLDAKVDAVKELTEMERNLDLAQNYAKASNEESMKRHLEVAKVHAVKANKLFSYNDRESIIQLEWHNSQRQRQNPPPPPLPQNNPQNSAAVPRQTVPNDFFMQRDPFILYEMEHMNASFRLALKCANALDVIGMNYWLGIAKVHATKAGASAMSNYNMRENSIRHQQVEASRRREMYLRQMMEEHLDTAMKHAKQGNKQYMEYHIDQARRFAMDVNADPTYRARAAEIRRNFTPITHRTLMDRYLEVAHTWAKAGNQQMMHHQLDEAKKYAEFANANHTYNIRATGIRKECLKKTELGLMENYLSMAMESAKSGDKKNMESQLNQAVRSATNAGATSSYNERANGIRQVLANKTDLGVMEKYLDMAAQSAEKGEKDMMRSFLTLAKKRATTTNLTATYNKRESNIRSLVESEDDDDDDDVVIEKVLNVDEVVADRIREAEAEGRVVTL